jgi:hypothetical protein
MTTALEGDEWSAAHPGRNLPPGKTRYPSYRRLGGSQDRSGLVRKISPPPGFDPRTVRPVVSRYTDSATRPTQNIQSYIQCNTTEPKNMKEAVKLHTVCISYNDDRHPIPKTFTPLQYTSLHFTTTFTPLHQTFTPLRYNIHSTSLHIHPASPHLPSTSLQPSLHYTKPSLHYTKPSPHFATIFTPPHIYSTSPHLHYNLHSTSLHCTPLHFTPLHCTPLHYIHKIKVCLSFNTLYASN